MSSALAALWLPLAALCGVATGGLLIGGLAGVRRAGPRRAAPTDATARPAPAVLGPRPLAADQLDVELELRACLHAHDAEAADRSVRLEAAIQPGLTVRADRGALRRAVTSVLANALAHTAGGCIMVAAGRHGGRVQIAVLDDGAAVDRAEEEAHLREAERLLALQGGTLEVMVRAGVGSTVVMRLPEPAPARDAQPMQASSVVAPASDTKAAKKVVAQPMAD